MESRIAKELKLRHEPVAIIFTDQKPEGALQFTEGRWGCAVAMMTAAAKGKTAVFDRSTAGCMGGKVGLCFGNTYPDVPGGIENFLSTGTPGREGEAYKKSPELAKSYADQLPFADIPEKYVIFKPLANVGPARETPQVVCMYTNPDQLSALVVLANYGRPGADNVIIPFSAGCHTICLLPYHEGQQERPRAVVGLTDITARPYIDADLLSFSVPWGMFLEMESNVSGSFLEKHQWQKVRERISFAAKPAE